MHTQSTSVVTSFLMDHFLPTVDQAIKNKVAERKLVKKIPKIVTHSIVMNVFEPSLKSTNKLQSKEMPKDYLTQAYENTKPRQFIKVPKRKQQTFLASHINETILPQAFSKASQRSISQMSTKSSNLIKLPSTIEEQSEQVKNIRKMKYMMRKYQQMKEKNHQMNNQTRKSSYLEKKGSLNHCLYHHTYDYQADIIPVNPLSLQNQEIQQRQQSLLQILKKNLDREVQHEKLQNKLKQINERQDKKLPEKIPSCKIDKVEEDQEGFKVRQKGKVKEVGHQKVDRFLKPYYKFEKSKIGSLSQHIDNHLSYGVKMVTLEEKLIQQSRQQGEYMFKIKAQSIVKEKPLKKKLKTNSSQSVIYSLENQMRNRSSIESHLRAQSTLQEHQKYRSLQCYQENEENYDALSELLGKQSNKMTLDTDSRVRQFKLPEIKNSPQKKRTSTEKITRGLQGIEVSVKASIPTPFNRRSRHCSTLSLNKYTQSSTQEDYSPVIQGRKARREAVKDYFNNYKEQFKQKMKGISQAVNLYA